MGYTSTKTGTWRTDVADSVDDVVAFASGPSPWDAKQWNRQSQDMTFALKDVQTNNFTEAADLVRKGWPAGRRQLSDNLDAAKFVQTNSTHLADALDVAGAYPSVPDAIAGNPACMVTRGLEQSATRPIYRFLISLSVSCDVKGETMMRRGAAILSWVDRLEAEGARCEVFCINTVRRSGMTYTQAVTAKRADEPLDVDRLAFVLAHPSMLRRILFGCYERHEDVGEHLRGSYGTPTDLIPDDLKTAHSIYFGMMHSGQSHWHDNAKAVAEVERVIAEAIRHGDEATHNEQEAA